MAIRDIASKMAEGAEYLEYSDKLESSRQNFRYHLIGALLTEMAAFELTVRTAVRGYHVYKEVWAPAIGEEFVCGQDWGNDHDRHAVVVHKEGKNVLGHTPSEFCDLAHAVDFPHTGCLGPSDA